MHDDFWFRAKNEKEATGLYFTDLPNPSTWTAPASKRFYRGEMEYTKSLTWRHDTQMSLENNLGSTYCATECKRLGGQYWQPTKSSWSTPKMILEAATYEDAIYSEKQKRLVRKLFRRWKSKSLSWCCVKDTQEVLSAPREAGFIHHYRQEIRQWRLSVSRQEVWHS